MCKFRPESQCTVREGRARRENNSFLSTLSTTQPSSHGAAPAGPGHWAGRCQEDGTEGWEPDGTKQLGEITGFLYLLSDNTKLGAGKDWEESLPAGFMARGLITPPQAEQCARRYQGTGQELLGKRQGGRAPRAAQEYLLSVIKPFPALFCSLTNWFFGDLIFHRWCGDLGKLQVCQAGWWDGQMAHAGICVSANPRALAGDSGAWGAQRHISPRPKVPSAQKYINHKA